MAASHSSSSHAVAKRGTSIFESSVAPATKLVFVGVALVVTASLSLATTTVCASDISSDVPGGGVGTRVLRKATVLEDDGFSEGSVHHTNASEEEQSRDGLDVAVPLREADWGLGDLQHVVEELKKAKDVVGAVERVEFARDTKDEEARDTLQEVNSFLNRAGLSVDIYQPGCPGAYAQTVLESFHRPVSLLEPSGLRAYFDFHVAIVENTNEWLADESEYFQQVIQPKVVDGVGLARLFAASYEIILAEAISVAEHVERPERASRQLVGDAIQSQSLGIYVSSLRQLSWQMDAVLGEASGVARTHTCHICGSLFCRWTCGMKKAFSAAADSLVALMTQLVSIFETVQGLLETAARVQCFSGENSSTFEHREAREAFEQHASTLSSGVSEFQRLVKHTGERLQRLYEKMGEFTSLVIHKD